MMHSQQNIKFPWRDWHITVETCYQEQSPQGMVLKMLPWEEYHIHIDSWSCDMSSVESTINIFCNQPLKSKGKSVCEDTMKAYGEMEV